MPSDGTLLVKSVMQRIDKQITLKKKKRGDALMAREEDIPKGPTEEWYLDSGC